MLDRPTLLLALAGLFTGVAFADPASTLIQVPVDVGAATLLEVPVGQLTGPVAMLAAGGLLGRLLRQLAELVTKLAAELKGWRPHIIVEHRHLHAADPAEEGDR